MKGYMDIHIGIPMRRRILTELAEVRERRNARTKLFDAAILAPTFVAARVDRLGVQRDGDREHIASLMRLLHALRGDQ